MEQRCVWTGGIVQEVVIVKNKLFRYVICNPAFSETCDKYVEKLRERGVDFVKVSTTDREFLKRIEGFCYSTGNIVLK